MLKYLRKRHKQIYIVQLKATDVLYTKMHAYNNEAKEILKYLIEQTRAQNANAVAEMKKLYSLMDKADAIAIDCAHKLAPYQTPKLESIEVKNRVEHRFIIRAPQKIATLEEWTKKTGAEQLKTDQLTKKIDELTPPAPSIHDFDCDEGAIASSEHSELVRDEINTRKRLN